RVWRRRTLLLGLLPHRRLLRPDPVSDHRRGLPRLPLLAVLERLRVSFGADLLPASPYRWRRTTGNGSVLRSAVLRRAGEPQLRRQPVRGRPVHAVLEGPDL